MDNLWRGLAAIPNQKTLNIASIGFKYSLPSYRLHHYNKKCMQSNKKRILSNFWNDTVLVLVQLYF